MIDKEFLQIVEKIRQKVTNPLITEREMNLIHTVKLGEEVGEVCDVIASFAHSQRSDKKTLDLGEEIADVLLVSLQLAQHHHIDINEALEKKLQKIKQRLDY